MHDISVVPACRLPVYRMRMLDIYRASSEAPVLGSKAGLAAAESPALVKLARDVAPMMHIDSAAVVAWDTASVGLPGGSLSAGPSMPAGSLASLLSGLSLPPAAASVPPPSRSDVWKSSFPSANCLCCEGADASTAFHPAQAWLGLLLRMLLGVRLLLGSVRNAAAGSATVRLVVALHGSGLDMCSAASMHLPGARPQPAQVCRRLHATPKAKTCSTVCMSLPAWSC